MKRSLASTALALVLGLSALPLAAKTTTATSWDYLQPDREQVIASLNVVELLRRTEVLAEQQQPDHGLAEDHRLRRRQRLGEDPPGGEPAPPDEEAPDPDHEVDRDHQDAEAEMDVGDHAGSIADPATRLPRLAP